jgi:hypothetical protein
MSHQEEHYGRIGDPIGKPRPAVFELVVEDHVSRAGAVDPRDYFITSGDAVAKARILAKDLESEGHPAEAQRARLLVLALEAARGDAIFLEIEYDPDHRLLCIPKNPRSRPEV